MGRNLSFVWPPVALAQVRKQVEEQTGKALENDAFQWVIEDRAGTAVGAIETHHCDHQAGVFSYSINIAREHQRNGYATEAIRLVLHYYFAELRYHKASVRVFSHNQASIRLHEKLGFVQEGTLRQEIYTRGAYYDIVCYGLLQAEYGFL